MKVMRCVLSTVGVIGLGAVTALSVPGPATAKSDRGDFADVRRATAQFHNPARAVAAGYTATDECVPNMGYHYVNFRLFNAPIDPLKPAALLYAPKDGGGRQLIGVEYFEVDHDRDLATHNDPRPALFGRSFEGPMPGHFEGMPIHYDLHAYIWSSNPDGTLEPWNPDITCP